MTFSADPRFHRQLFLFNGLLPAVLILVDGWRGKLGANPVEYVTRATGVLTEHKSALLKIADELLAREVQHPALREKLTIRLFRRGGVPDLDVVKPATLAGDTEFDFRFGFVADAR